MLLHFLNENLRCQSLQTYFTTQIKFYAVRNVVLNKLIEIDFLSNQNWTLFIPTQHMIYLPGIYLCLAKVFAFKIKYF